jgi:hypothetical protein
MKHALLALNILALVMLTLTGYRQNVVIEQQRALINYMAQNPACMGKGTRAVPPTVQAKGAKAWHKKKAQPRERLNYSYKAIMQLKPSPTLSLI